MNIKEKLIAMISGRNLRKGKRVAYYDQAFEYPFRTFRDGDKYPEALSISDLKKYKIDREEDDDCKGAV